MSDASTLLQAAVNALRSLDDELLDEFLELLPPDDCPGRAMPARPLAVRDESKSI